jgi:predicted amidohydrolase
LGVYNPGELIHPGGSVIVNPLGTIVAGPAHGEECILLADASPAEALLARRGFDVVGHYGRTDILGLMVRGKVLPLANEDAFFWPE